MKVGIAGYGRIAGVHADAWRSVDGIELAAVCDASLTAREKAVSQGLRAYSDIETMLDAENLGAISICTPPNAHAEAALAAIERGVGVLCEKPLTTSKEQTASVVESASELGSVLQMATKFRHVPEILFAKSAIAEGEIGDLMTFHIEFAGAVEMINRWNSVPSISGGGVIIDNGSHALDLVNFVFGSLNKVQAVPIKSIQRLPVEDQAMLLVEAGKGIFGEIVLSWSLGSSSDTYLAIRGSKGSINLGWKGAYLQKDGKDPVKLSNGYDKNVAHHNMMVNFQGLLADTCEPWISHDEILTNSTAVAACYDSLRSNNWAGVESFGMVAA